MSQHSRYHYSIMVKTDDLPLLYCLRALSMYAQRTGNNKIPWGNTSDKNWKQNQHQVTFHFSRIEYRNLFISEIQRLLPQDLWIIICKRDDDPAKPP